MSHNDIAPPRMKDVTAESSQKTQVKKTSQSKNRQHKPYVCGICGNVFAQPRSLVLHLRIHNQEKSFSCHLCSKNFARSDHLKSHILRHLRKGNHPCSKCDKIFKRADRLKYHEVNEHGSTISLKELRTYAKTSTHGQRKTVQCETCGKSFYDYKSLKMHNTIHSESHKYQCKYCEKSFNQRSNLNVHVRKHTGKKPYKCESCSETFTTSSKLKTHARKHTGDLPFVCDVCGKCFGESHLLKMHFRIHNNVRSYVCTYCGRGFTHSSTLQAHMRIHTGARPYMCDICQESFAQISSLIYHKRTHTGEKPFMCDICGNKYTRRTTLNTHRSRHTGDNHYSCSQCDFKCDVASQLRKHVQQYHVMANGPTRSIHNNMSKNADTDTINHEKNANQQQNASQFLISSPDEALDKCIRESACSKVPNNFSPKLSLESIIQQPTASNSVLSWRLTCKDSFYNLIPDSDNLPNCENSSSEILMPALPLNSSQPVISSFQKPVKSEENELMDPIIMSTLKTSINPAELPHTHNDSLLHPSSSHESPILTHTHTVFPSCFNKICDTDNASSHPAVDSEINSQSQLCNLSSKGKFFNDIQTSETMSKCLSILSFPNARSNFQSPSTEPLPQAMYVKCADAMDQSQFPSLSKTVTKSCPLDAVECEAFSSVDIEAISSNVFASEDNLDVNTSLKDRFHKAFQEQDKNNAAVSSSSGGRKVSNGDDDKIESSCNAKNKVQNVSSPAIQRTCIDIKQEKEMLNEDNIKARFEPSPVCLPDAIGTRHYSRCEDTSKNEKQDSIDTASILSREIVVKIPRLSSEEISMYRTSRNFRKTKQSEKSKACEVSGERSETTTLQICQICGETLTSKSLLVTHIKLHLGDSLQCSICFREFSRSDHLISHLLLHSRPRQSKCVHCFEEFAQLKLLDEHVQKMHNGTYPFRCKGCDFSCLEILQLKGHIWQMHSEHDFSCHVCHIIAKTSKGLKEHMKEHTNEEAYDCVQCSRSFPQKSVLKLHVMRKHGGEKLFACGICSESYFAAAELQRHLKLHTGDRPFTCEVCKKGFIDAKRLRIHSKIHSGDKPFRCNQCGCQFVHSGTLRNHMRIHTGVKPYKCEVCGDVFTQSSSLSCHQQIHDRKKMYTCHLCGKSYTRMATLNVHLNRHAGRSRFSCQECGYHTNNALTLKRHMKKQHRDKAM